MSKFLCHVWRRCDNIAENEVPTWPASNAAGMVQTVPPSSLFKAYRTPMIRYALTLVVFLPSQLPASAQDVNVHIEPKPTSAP